MSGKGLAPPTGLKVSIVVPMFRGEKHLRDCLTSLQKQTHDNLEVICVDDGSPDSCATIAREYAKGDERFIVVSQENMGLSEARNTGVRAATGQYVLFVDQDDALRREALEVLINTTQEATPILVTFPFSEVSEDSAVGDLSGQILEPVDGGNLLTMSGVSRLAQGFIEEWWQPRAQLLFILREFLEESKTTFFPGILHEDNLYTYQILCRVPSMLHVNRELAIIRQTSGSMSRSTKSWHHSFSFAVTLSEMVAERRRTKVESVAQWCGLRYAIHHVLDQTVDAYVAMDSVGKAELWRRMRKSHDVSPGARFIFWLNTAGIIGIITKGVRHHFWRVLRGAYRFVAIR